MTEAGHGSARLGMVRKRADGLLTFLSSPHDRFTQTWLFQYVRHPLSHLTLSRHKCLVFFVVLVVFAIIVVRIYVIIVLCNSLISFPPPVGHIRMVDCPIRFWLSIHS